MSDAITNGWCIRTLGPHDKREAARAAAGGVKREKERRALRSDTGPGTCYGPSSNIPLRPRGNCRSQASSADANRFASNELASSTPSSYLDPAGNAMHVLVCPASLNGSGSKSRQPWPRGSDRTSTTGPPCPPIQLRGERWVGPPRGDRSMLLG
jgi:hypothetical protein